MVAKLIKKPKHDAKEREIISASKPLVIIILNFEF